MFPQLISAWRAAFDAPGAYFGFVQLSTWCAWPPSQIPQMRDAQMDAITLPNVGYATNADHGFGCNIHPPAKRFVGERLANAALGLLYEAQWRSPTYLSALPLPSLRRGASVVARLNVDFRDVGDAGLHLVYPSNYRLQTDAEANATVLDCTAPVPINQTTNGSMADQCAWAGLLVRGAGWLNATVTVQPSGRAVLLSAVLPPVASRQLADVVIEASAYAWGPVPMMSVYDVATQLPALGWNVSLPPRAVRAGVQMIASVTT
jgi:hypothetical protein